MEEEAKKKASLEVKADEKGYVYQEVVFMQGEEAREPLKVLEDQGEQAALEYLKQWDAGEGGEESEEAPWGTSDTVYWNEERHRDEDYVMSYNKGLEYIGLCIAKRKVSASLTARGEGDTIIHIDNLNAGGDVAIKPRELPEGEYNIEMRHDHESGKEPKLPKAPKQHNKLPIGPKDKEWPKKISPQTEPSQFSGTDPQEKSTGYGGDRGGGVFVSPADGSTSLSSLKEAGDEWKTKNLEQLEKVKEKVSEGEYAYIKYLIENTKSPQEFEDYMAARNLIFFLYPDRKAVRNSLVAAAANPAAKTRPVDNPYEVWQTPDGTWTWKVLKKYQSPENEAKNEYARWFCMVYSPFVPDGEMGDVYVKDIKGYAKKVSGGEESAVSGYKSLNDAAKLIPGLTKGSTEIWYWKDIASMDTPTTPETLKDTHVLLGSIEETDPEQIYAALQGESWSPKGEAKDLIRGLGLSHTSMSVGDVIKIGDKYMVVAAAGFEELGKETKPEPTKPTAKMKFRQITACLKKKAAVEGEEIKETDVLDGSGDVLNVGDSVTTFDWENRVDALHGTIVGFKADPNTGEMMVEVNFEGEATNPHLVSPDSLEKGTLPPLPEEEEGFQLSPTKEDIKDIYDSLVLVSTSGDATEKPPFEKIENRIEKYDNNYLVFTEFLNQYKKPEWHWYELEDPNAPKPPEEEFKEVEVPGEMEVPASLKTKAVYETPWKTAPGHTESIDAKCPTCGAIVELIRLDDDLTASGTCLECGTEIKDLPIKPHASLETKAGKDYTMITKDKIESIYDSLEMVSTSDKAMEADWAKPSFESIEDKVEAADDGSFIVRIGNNWYELDPVRKEPNPEEGPSGMFTPSALKTKAEWSDRIQNIYHDFSEFKAYNDVYRLAERLGFHSAEEAWENNPIASGSTDPGAYHRVDEGVA
jgi:hypothetical protein